MTNETPPGYAPDETYQGPDVIPVHIAGSDVETVINDAPYFGSCMTWNVDTLVNMGKPVQLLTRRYKRQKAKIFVATLGPVGAIATGQGQQTTPPAGTNIAVISAGSFTSGWYNIGWVCSLSGTLAAAEVDNFQLRYASGTLATASNPDIAGEYPQTTYGPIFLNNTNGVQVRNNALATTGAIYSADITLTPVIPAPSGFAVLVLNSKQEPLTLPTPQGAYIYNPVNFDWETQLPLYAVLAAGSTGPVQIAVIDQAYQEKDQYPR